MCIISYLISRNSYLLPGAAIRDLFERVLLMVYKIYGVNWAEFVLEFPVVFLAFCDWFVYNELIVKFLSICCY